MKNWIKVVVVLLVFTWACDEADETESRKEWTPAEAKANVDIVGTEMRDDVVEMVSSEGASALLGLLDLMSMDDVNLRVAPNENIENVKTTARRIGKAFNPIKNARTKRSEDEEDDGLSFEENWGVYEWNFDIENFEKTDEQIDHIEIYFPAEESLENNAVFKLLEFESTLIDGYDEATKIVAQLYLDDILTASLLLAIDYSFVGEIESANVTMFLAPFEYAISYDYSNVVSASSSISRDDVSLLACNLTVSFNDAEMEEPNIVDASVSYRELKVVGTLDAAGAEAAGEGADLNDYIDATVFYDESKLGDIVFAASVSDPDIFDVYLEYSDGTQELLEDILEPMIVEMEDLILEIEGENI